MATLMTSGLLAPARPGLSGGATWLPGHTQPRLGEASRQLAAGLPLIPGQLRTPGFSRPFISNSAQPPWASPGFPSQPPLLWEGEGTPQDSLCSLDPGLPPAFLGITRCVLDPLLPTRTQDLVLRRIPHHLCVELKRAALTPPLSLLTVWLWTSHWPPLCLSSHLREVWTATPPFAGCCVV